mmetsp:Transcript_110937/g.345766  ORF Transcript_110937/g.345766 Transcript_110937/m.345766 type:complete len:299 (-) Transcript_110937:247-1143(-)
MAVNVWAEHLVPSYEEQRVHEDHGQEAGHPKQFRRDAMLESPLQEAQSSQPRGPLRLEENIVPPSEVQHLKPEAECHQVTHCEADCIQTTSAGQRGAGAEAPEEGHADVAGLLATAVQSAERDLTDGVKLPRRLEVTSGARHDQEGAVGVAGEVLHGQVLAVVEVVLVQAPLVVLMEGGPELRQDRQDADAGQERNVHDGVPQLGVIPHHVTARTLRYRTKHSPLRALHHEDEEQARSYDADDVLQQLGAAERRSNEGKDSDSHQHLDERRGDVEAVHLAEETVCEGRLLVVHPAAEP